MSRALATMAALAVVVSSFALNANVALGHERRTVGPYTFVVGWINEPAYINLLNSLDLTVTETSGAKPVEGLDKTLKADLTYGGTLPPEGVRPRSMPQPAHSRQRPTTAECARSALKPCSPLSRLARGASTLMEISSSDPQRRQTRWPCCGESARRQRVTPQETVGSQKIVKGPRC